MFDVIVRKVIAAKIIERILKVKIVLVWAGRCIALGGVRRILLVLVEKNTWVWRKRIEMVVLMDLTKFGLVPK